MNTSIIIPALNEEQSIKNVLISLPDDPAIDVIVVDGGSSDRTVEIAEKNNALVINEYRRGYGRACAVGTQQSRADIVVFIDADGANDPGQVTELVKPIMTEDVDMVLGSRLAGRVLPGAMPWHQRVGNWCSAKLIRTLYGLPITDLSPFRAVRRSKLIALDLQDMTYGFPTEMIVKAARRGWKIREIPVDYYPRTGGKSKISGTLRGTLYAMTHILGTIFRNVGY